MVLVATICGYLLTPAFLLAILFLALCQDLLFSKPRLHSWIKALCRALPLAFGVRIRVRNQGGNEEEKVGAGGTGRLYVCNHVNVFDPLILYASLPQNVRGVELEEHFSWPVWGTIIRCLGNIPISHKDAATAARSLRVAGRALKSGTSICILPEGHRTRNGRLGVFMRGPFALALATGADIVPMAMRGAYERKSVHSLRVRPGVVEIVFAAPVPSSRFHALSSRQLAAQVRTIVEGLLSG